MGQFACWKKDTDSYEKLAALKKYINNDAKIRKVYENYLRVGYGKKFFKEYQEEIFWHKATKEAFNQLDGKGFVM